MPMAGSTPVACDDRGRPCTQWFLLLKWIWETRWKEFAVTYLLESEVSQWKFLDETLVVMIW